MLGHHAHGFPLFKGVFTSVSSSSVETNSGLFSSLVQFVWVSVDAEIKLWYGPQQPDWDLLKEAVWYGSFVVRTSSDLNPPQLQEKLDP